MPDNTNHPGFPDPSLVSQQEHEVRYLMNKFGLSEATVRRVVRSHGPKRTAVEAELQRIKWAGGH